jgi:hypothetical protein
MGWGLGLMGWGVTRDGVGVRGDGMGIGVEMGWGLGLGLGWGGGWRWSGSSGALALPHPPPRAALAIAPSPDQPPLGAPPGGAHVVDAAAGGVPSDLARRVTRHPLLRRHHRQAGVVAHAAAAELRGVDANAWRLGRVGCGENLDGRGAWRVLGPCRAARETGLFSRPRARWPGRGPP